VTIPVLQLEGISKSYPGTKALDNVSFNAYAGQVNALVGANGAGKSTLIKIVSGAINKDSGSMFINGEEVNIKNPQHAQDVGVSVIYQEFSVLSNLTIAENIFLGREFGKGEFINNKLQAEHALEMLKIVGLEGYDPDTMVEDLSNPQKQMVEFAKALSINAKVILMDEPSAVLTEEELGHLYHQLEVLKKQGIAIVFVSHRISEVLNVSDTITVLKDGKNADFMTREEATHNRIVSSLCGRDVCMDTILANVTRNAEPELEVDDLHVGNIVNGVSLSVYGGEIVGLAGLVGSGRTETAQCIFGARKFDRGTIKIKGKQVHFKYPGQAVSQRIGLVPEDRKGEGILAGLSVSDNLTLASLELFARYGVINRKKQDINADGFVSSLNIRTPSIHQTVGNLSGGNQQKVVVGKWLTRKADILILPTQGIDVGSRDEIYQIVRKLADQGKAILFISSDLEEIMRVCDRILIMYKGNIVRELLNQDADQEKLLLFSTGGGK
jgi:ribose transport system ATP-binding protein